MLAIILFLFASYAGVAFAAPGDERWISMNPELAGTNGPVTVMKRAGGYLYVAGSFTVVRDVLARNIARLHLPTDVWEPLGTGFSAVRDIAVADDGTIYLYAVSDEGMTGIFHGKDGLYELIGTVTEEAVVNSMGTDGTGNLYVSGDLSAVNDTPVRGMARWDGVSWEDIGDARAMPENGFWLVVDVAGGLYRYDRWALCERRAGAVWEDIAPADVGNYPAVLALDATGDLYAQVLHLPGDGTPGYVQVYRWEGGNQWTSFCDGLSGLYDDMLFDPDGRLFLRSAEEQQISVCGEGSLTLLRNFGAAVHAMAVGDDGDFYAAGAFPGYLLRREGGSWGPVGDGMLSALSGMITDAQGTLHLSGSFSATDACLARYDDGLAAPFGNDTAGCGLLGFDTQDRLIVSGWWEMPRRSVSWVTHVRRWDGAWTTLGENGFGDGAYGFANVAVWDATGDLYVAGTFEFFGDAVNNIARLDGTTWAPLGAGTNEEVLALAAGIDGGIYAGGLFTTAGDMNAAHVAHWDGTSWHSLGAGTDGTVNSLAVGPTGMLYAGGDFTVAGDKAASHIARWDGTAWHRLGSGMNGTVSKIVVDGAGRLYAAGDFTEAGGVAVNHLARWDGTVWHPLGSGADDTVKYLAAGKSDTLYAGGEFTSVGGKSSFYLAAYSTENEESVSGEEVLDDEFIPDDDALIGDESDENDLVDEEEIGDSPFTAHDSLVADADTATPNDHGCGCSMVF